jgi:hypothetical protein
MHSLFLSLGFLVLFFAASEPTHQGLCDVIAEKATTQNVLGKNVGYYVVFKNHSKSEVDALEWEAFFYNNFNDLKGSVKGNWSSGNFIDPIKPGETTKDLESAWIDGATKVFITIKRVHFVNGKSCGSKSK